MKCNSIEAFFNYNIYFSAIAVISDVISTVISLKMQKWKKNKKYFIIMINKIIIIADKM